MKPANLVDGLVASEEVLEVAGGSSGEVEEEVGQHEYNYTNRWPHLHLK